jgi:hypothetical protein
VIEELQEIEGHEEIIDRIVERLFPTINGAQNVDLLRLTAPPPVSTAANAAQLSEWDEPEE